LSSSRGFHSLLVTAGLDPAAVLDCCEHSVPEILKQRRLSMDCRVKPGNDE